MQSIINSKSLRFSINVRLTSLNLLNVFIKKINEIFLQLEIILFPRVKLVYNFVNCKTRFAFFNDIKIIEIDLLLMK